MTTQYKIIKAKNVTTSLFYKGSKFFEINLYEDERGGEIENQTTYTLVVPYRTGLSFSNDAHHNSLEEVFLTILKQKDEIEKLLNIKIDKKWFTDFESEQDIREVEELLVRVES